MAKTGYVSAYHYSVGVHLFCGYFWTYNAKMTNIDPALIKAAAFYDQHYAPAQPLFLRPGDKFFLGNKNERLCRFCGLGEPDATFKDEAHVIPEALGNKSLFSYYECDACNGFFGKGIENDLGNWTKPSRTLYRIHGKKGVPSIKKRGKEPGWRIDYEPTGFVIKEYEDDPFMIVDEANKTVTFEFTRDAYTPVAVLKAFVKIGLAVLPTEELSNFTEAMTWIREADHSKRLVNELPLIRSFQPGPMPNDLTVLMLFRRRINVTGVPYAFFVLSFGNEVFQVFLPSPKQDAAINGLKLNLPPFPVPGSLDRAKYGNTTVTMVDLTGCNVVRGETVSCAMGFENFTRNEPDSDAKSS